MVTERTTLHGHGTSNAYSSPGDLVATSDAIGNHVCYQYDQLHRVTDVTNSAQSTTNFCKRFRYDNVSKGVTTQPSGSTISTVAGRLVEAETDSCASPGSTLITDEWFSYDADGRTTDMWEITPHSGQYYHSTATFYGNGKVNTLQLASPSLYTMTYGLDGEGRWDTLTDTTSSQNLVTGPTTTGGMYDAAGHVLNVRLTGTTPDQDIYTYDPNTGRMKTFEFEVGNTPANLTGTLTWNNNGTLAELQITDGFNSGGTQTCYSNSASALGYGYDDLGRLVEFDCGSGNWGQQFSYDQYGNLTKAVISGRTGTTWNPGYNAATNQCIGCTYWSNGSVNNGDLTGDGNNVYGWNVYSKLAWTATSGTPTCGSSGRCIVYDAFGHMVERSSNSTWQEVWITQAGSVYMSGTTPTFAFFPAPGGTALVGGNSSYFDYLHMDWLGSERLASNLATNVVTADRAYSPYGEEYDIFSTGLQYDMFAGTDAHLDDGVMWDTANRELSMVGRWLSPDPAGLGAVDTSNPQSWNRYAYVGGNPLSFTDPTGLGGPAGVACRNSVNANSANCVRYSANCTQAAGFCPPDSMNRDALAKQAQPCDEECQYQGRVDDAFNGTHYMDDPNVYSNGRFRLPPASGWFYETYGKGGSIGYDWGWWNYPSMLVNGEDEHPGLAALFDSAQCPTCGQTLRSADKFVKVAMAVEGAALLGGLGVAELGASPAGDYFFANGGILNSNNFLRIGWSGVGPNILDGLPIGGAIFRIAIGASSWGWPFPIHIP